MSQQWIQNQIKKINGFTLDKLRSSGKMPEEGVKQHISDIKKMKGKEGKILEGIGDAIIILDRELNIVWTNEIALNKWNAIPGKKCYQIIKSRLDPCSFCNAKRTLVDGKIRSSEEDIVAKDGKSLNYMATYSLISDKRGKNDLIAMVFHDTTMRKMAEKKLKDSEERYRNVVERSNDGIIIVQDGMVKHVNVYQSERMGYTIEELINTPFIDYIHPDERPRLLGIYKRRMAGEDVPRIYETVVKHKDGTDIDVEVNAGITTYKGKQADIVVIRDITERKLAENVLKFNNVILSTQQETSLDGILVVDENRRIISFNQRFIDMWDIPPKVIETCSDEITLQSVIDKIADPAEFLNMVKYLSDHKEDKMHAEIFLKDGRILDHYSAPMNGRDRKYYGRVLYFRDITERKIAEKELRTAHQKLTDIIEFLPDATFVIDSEKKVIAWNRAIEEMTGVKKEEILGKGDYSYAVPFYGERRPILVDHLSIPDSEHNYNFVEKKGNTLLAETFVPSVYGGKGAHLWVVASSLFDNTGKEIGAIESIRDITERKIAEKELRAAHQRLMDIIEFLPDATFVIDSEKKVIAWNRAIEEMTGVKKEEILGKGDYAYAVPFYGERRPILVDLVSIPDSEIKQKYNFVEKKGNSLHGEAFTPFTYGGKGAHLSGKASPLFDLSGKQIGAIESIRDITERKKMRDALKEQKEFASKLVQYSTVPTFVIDSKHRILNWNHAIEELTGIKASEIIGTDRFYRSKNASLADVVVSRELNEHLESNKKYIRSKYLSNGLHYENWVSNLNGRKKYILFDSAPIYNSKGELVGALETLQGITEQKQTEQMIKQRLEVETAIATISSFFVAPPDIDASIDEALDKIGRLCGASRSYVFLLRENDTIMDNTHEWCNEGVEPQKEKLQNLPTSVCPWWMTRLRNNEIIHIPDVSSMPPEASAEKKILETENIDSLMVLPIYSKGKLMGYIGMDNVVNTGEWSESSVNILHMVSDVVGMAIERRQSEKKVSSLKQQLEFILGATKTGIDIIDSEFNIRYIDPEWAKVYGDPTGRKCYEYFMDLDDICPGCAIPKALKTKATIVSEEVLTREGNRPIQVITKPFKNEDGEWLVAEINVDIKERKQAEDKLKKYTEELQHSNKLKDLFTDILHHDLLNPAGIIRGHTEILLDTEENEQRRQSLYTIERNLEKIIRIIQRASKFAKLESMEELEFQEMDIGAIFKGVIENFSRRIEDKQMIVEFNTNGGYPASVNPVIEGVFANLLFNAIKYSPEKSRIIIDIVDAGDEWKVSVTDFGDGLSDEDKTKLFERFKRADKNGAKGAGLGLAIVKRLISLHGGSVGVEDNPEGQGSLFWVTVKKA